MTTHKEALRIAAREVLVTPDANMEECLLEAMRAYLEARGLVMVPRGPREEMVNAADSVLSCVRSC